jgi:hypothetical protein
MKCSRNDLMWAASQNIISVDQAKSLWEALNERGKGTSKFDFVHLLYYAGAVIVILAMGWFLGTNWDAIGPGGIFGVSSVYALLFYFAGGMLWSTRDLKIPGGLLVTLGVFMTPLITYSLLGILGFWQTTSNGWMFGYHQLDEFGWIVIHTTTACAALVALYFVRFPFLMAPFSWAIWAIATTGSSLFWSSSSRDTVSIFYGICMLLVAYGIDLRRNHHRDFAFWLYLFGSFSLLWGLVFVNKGDFVEFLFFLCFVAMMLASVVLQRKALMVFGAFGSIGYLFHISYTIFHESPLFPMVLVVCGLATIACGVVVQRNREQLRRTIFGAIPSSWREYLPEQP